MLGLFPSPIPASGINQHLLRNLAELFQRFVSCLFLPRFPFLSAVFFRFPRVWRKCVTAVWHRWTPNPSYHLKFSSKALKASLTSVHVCRMWWIWRIPPCRDHVRGDVWRHLVLEGAQSKTERGRARSSVTFYWRRRSHQDPQGVLLHQQHTGQELQAGQVWQLVADKGENSWRGVCVGTSKLF